MTPTPPARGQKGFKVFNPYHYHAFVCYTSYTCMSYYFTRVHCILYKCAPYVIQRALCASVMHKCQTQTCDMHARCLYVKGVCAYDLRVNCQMNTAFFASIVSGIVDNANRRILVSLRVRASPGREPLTS
jgi:hypothetical protein